MSKAQRWGCRGRHHVILCIILPSIIFGYVLRTYLSIIQSTTRTISIPGSLGFLIDVPSQSICNHNTTRDALDPPTDKKASPAKPQHNGTFDDGYRSPVESMLPHFGNRAIEQEMIKHDRLIIDSLAYLMSFNSARDYLELMKKQTKNTSSQQMITIIILTVNRAVPYIAATLASLVRGHSKEEFVNKLNVHVCNLEKRPDRMNTYNLFQTLQQRFTFINFHNWNEKYTELSSIRSRDVLYMEEQRRDYIKTLSMCKDAGSKWCVVLEDDTVFPVRFADKFNRYVNSDELEFARAGGGNGTVKLKAQADLMMVKLYSPFNNQFDKSGKSLSTSEYGRDGYDIDRAIDVVEARKNCESVKEVKYSLKLSTSGYGIVSNAYPAHILAPMIDHLTKTKFQIGQPTDTAINFLYYLKTKKIILETVPSMINHIGHYSENANGGASIGEGRLSTDVRFQIDDAHRR